MEIAIVIEQLAKTLSAVPVVGQAVLAAELLQAAGAEKSWSSLRRAACG